MGRTERMATACVAAAVAALALPAVAPADWQAPMEIGTQPDMQDVHLGIDQFGSTKIAWMNPAGELKVRNRSIVPTLGIPQTVATAASPDFDFALAWNATAVFAWLESDGT